MMENGIEPLKATIRRGTAKPEEVVLCHTLFKVYRDVDRSARAIPAGTTAGYASIEGQVRRIAAAHRRRSALREIWIGLGAWRLLVGVSALATVLTIGLSAGRLWPASAGSTVKTGSSLVVESRARLKSVGNDSLRVTLAGGATLELRGTIEVDQSDASRVQVILLDKTGEVEVSVPHLGSGSSFIVSGAHADAIAHGTRFRVEDLGSSGTSVQVFEGLVEVLPREGNRPSVFLTAGRSLRVASIESHLRDLIGRVETAAQAGDCRAVENMVAATLEATPQGSDASAALYLNAVCAARAGDFRSAIRDFEDSARMSKDSTRADNALARAAELRQAANPAGGRAAWRAYLQRFPQGLHRGMAMQSLAGQPRAVR